MLQVALSPCNAALAVPCVLVVFWAVMRLRLEYRLRKNPGVRAPILANNPFGGKLCETTARTTQTPPKVSAPVWH